ncbi:MAG: hypothetical protein AAGE52_25120 [Myxococcota bacterium]
MKAFGMMVVLAMGVACGGSEEADNSGSAGGEDPAAGQCPDELGPCYNEETRAECRAALAECPSGQLDVLESCPVQYACNPGDEAPAGGDDPVSNETPCPEELGPCYNEETRAECRQVLAECASGQLDVLESCPVQFVCSDG